MLSYIESRKDKYKVNMIDFFKNKNNRKYILLAAILIFTGLVAVYIKLNRNYLNVVNVDTLAHTDGYYELQDFFLYAGDYAYSVSYKTDANNAKIMMVSDNTMQEDGTVGVTLFEKILDPNEDSIRMEISLPEDMYHIYLKVSDSVTVTDITSRNLKTYNDPIIFWALLVVISVLFIIGNKKLKKEAFDTVIFISVLSILSMIPYMNDFLPHSHDINFHLTRISGITQAIKQGQFPVKINSIQAWGYGYASSTMYPQFFLCVPVFFRLLGMSLLNSYKMLMFFIQIMTAIVSYVSFKGLFKERNIARIGCALYMFSMYRLDNLYVRGDVGESLAFVFLPLVVWGAYEVFFKDYSKWIILTLGMTGEVECHIISTEIYTIALAITFIVVLFGMKDRIKRVLALVKAALVALLLNAGFVIPFIHYYFEDFISTGTMGLYLADQTEYLSQMFVQFTHYYGKGNMPRGTTQNEMSLTIGIMPLVGLALYFIITRIYKDRIAEDEECKEPMAIAKGSVILFVIFTICSLWIIPWDIMPANPIIELISYPIYFFWRLIGIVYFFACCYICATVKVWLKFMPERNILIESMAVIIAIAMGWPAIDAMTQFPTYPNIESIANMNATDFNYLYMDTSFEDLCNRGVLVSTSSDDQVVKAYNRNALRVETDIDIINEDSEGYVEVPLYYYPGYQVTVNGSREQAIKGTNNVVRVNTGELGKGLNHIVVEYKQPVVWRIAEIITVITAFAIGLVYFRSRRCH